MKKLVINEAFGIAALLLLLIPQIAHTVFIFKANSHYNDPWFAWFYAAGVDMAILIFTVRGWIRTAIIYFIGTLAHNLVYQFWPESMWSAVLISFMLSGTIFSFSHLFYFKNEADRRRENAATPQLSPIQKRLEAAIKAGIRFEAQPYKCPSCGQSFESTKKLNGHVSSHKSKGEWDAENYGQWEEENERRVALAQGINNLHHTSIEPL